MAVINSSDLVSFVIAAKEAGWGYVYSAHGQLFTRELAEQWGYEKRAGRSYDYFVNQCARWFEKTAVDSSGLVNAAFRSKDSNNEYKSANTLFLQSPQKGKLSTIPEIPGICVWRNGHIGIYIGNNKVIEAAGTNIGVVLSLLSAPATGVNWTDWGKLQGVDYSSVSEAPPTEPPANFWLSRTLKPEIPYMSGDDVSHVQAALASKGFSPGEINGVYNSATQDAVKSFQQYAGLIPDGIVDINTTYSLLGVWVDRGDEDMQLSSFNLGRKLRLKLKRMNGSDVRDVQDALTLNAFSPGLSDGIYSKETKKAVKQFQKQNGLKPDGVVGPETVKALGGVWTGN